MLHNQEKMREGSSAVSNALSFCVKKEKLVWFEGLEGQYCWYSSHVTECSPAGNFFKRTQTSRGELLPSVLSVPSVPSVPSATDACMRRQGSGVHHLQLFGGPSLDN